MQLMSPAMHNGLTNVMPVSSIPKKQYVSSASSVRKLYFGNAQKPMVGPGLFVTMERQLNDVDGLRAGGLGSISLDMPYGINRPFELNGEQYAGIHTDTISPFYKNIKAANDSLENPYKDTGVATEFQYGDDGPMLTFRLMQRQEKVEGMSQPITSFTIASPLFDELNNPYVKTPEEEIDILHKITGQSKEELTKLIKDDGLKGAYRGNGLLAAVFSRAVAELLKKYQEANPESLASKYNFVVVNDWNPAYLPAYLDANDVNGMAEVYFVHNTHDGKITEDQAEKAGIPAEYLERYELIQHGEDPETGEDYADVSAIATGMSRADAILMSDDYAERVINPETGLGKGLFYRGQLEKVNQEARVYNTHHVPSDEFNPFNSHKLKENGFVELEGSDPKAVTPEQLEAFKSANKAALQKQIGLNENPDAFVAGFLLSRLDPYQKGIDLAVRNAEALLEEHPNLQLIIAGPISDEKVQTRLEAEFARLAEKFPGRFYGENVMVKGEDRIPYMAGVDALMMPSSYEPYGLSQLEAGIMGVVPIATNVDGMKKTVLDPEKDQAFADDEKLQQLGKEFGQTGYSIDEFNPAKYQQAVYRLYYPNPEAKVPTPEPTPEDLAYLAECDKKYRDGMTRAINKFVNERMGYRKIGVAGMKLVATEHSWDRKTINYGDVFLKAMERKGITERTYMPQAAFASGKRLSISG